MESSTKKEEKQLLLDLRYLRMARIWAENSYCHRRKVGALVSSSQTFSNPLGVPLYPSLIIIFSFTPKPTPLQSWHEALTTATAPRST